LSKVTFSRLEHLKLPLDVLSALARNMASGPPGKRAA
jgi:hypothetical protein